MPLVEVQSGLVQKKWERTPQLFADKRGSVQPASVYALNQGVTAIRESSEGHARDNKQRKPKKSKESEKLVQVLRQENQTLKDQLNLVMTELKIYKNKQREVEATSQESEPLERFISQQEKGNAEFKKQKFDISTLRQCLLNQYNQTKRLERHLPRSDIQSTSHAHQAKFGSGTPQYAQKKPQRKEQRVFAQSTLDPFGSRKGSLLARGVMQSDHKNGRHVNSVVSGS